MKKTARTIDQYIDQARAITGHDSDNQLAMKALGITSPAISAWRMGKAWPKDEIMIRLAALAEIDTHEALIDLNRWRSKDPGAQKEYASLLRRLQRAAAAILLAFLLPFGLGPQSADAAIQNRTATSVGDEPGLYIMGNRRPVQLCFNPQRSGV